MIIEVVSRMASLSWVILFNAAAVFCIFSVKVSERLIKGTEYYDEAVAFVLACGTICAIIAGIILFHM